MNLADMIIEGKFSALKEIDAGDILFKYEKKK
jgi:hypothetical protein